MKYEEVERMHESTGLSLSACKRILAVAGGDFDKAVELVRQEFGELRPTEPEVSPRKRVC